MKASHHNDTAENVFVTTRGWSSALNDETTVKLSKCGPEEVLWGIVLLSACINRSYYHLLFQALSIFSAPSHCLPYILLSLIKIQASRTKWSFFYLFTYLCMSLLEPPKTQRAAFFYPVSLFFKLEKESACCSIVFINKSKWWGLWEMEENEEKAADRKCFNLLSVIIVFMSI